MTKSAEHANVSSGVTPNQLDGGLHPGALGILAMRRSRAVAEAVARTRVHVDLGVRVRVQSVSVMKSLAHCSMFVSRMRAIAASGFA